MKHNTARRIAGWLIALMALVALHPVLAAAATTERSTGQALVELCTSHGMRWVSVDAKAPSADASDPSPSRLEASAAMDHCPLCRVVGDVLVDALRGDLRFAAPACQRQVPADEPRPFNAADHVVGDAPARAPPTGG